MKASSLAFVALSLSPAVTTSFGQFVRGNEAVTVMPDGRKRVETPPVPSSFVSKPCPAKQVGCGSGGWKMVETPGDLEECTELYARPGTCRASTFGNRKLPRIWIVKTRGRWLQCQHPDLASKCTSLQSLPYDAIQ